ncbi:MAG TPA: hypothetical protein VFQ86_04210 [Arachidicoccus soli]|nr:hypothetical protein [Arachidicoccus soli]
MKYLLLLMLPIFYACKDNNQNAQRDNTKIAQKFDTVKTAVDNNDSIIFLTINARDLPKTVRLSILHNYQKVFIEIADVHEHKIEGSITVNERNRNIRFNQIKMPDGSTDGPFGLNISYTTRQKGNYTLIIGKDNMADGILKGNATVSLILQ